MREVIVDMFPTEFSRYIEVFGGAGWVLFYKPKHAPFEVYNDFNGNLVNLFRVVRRNKEELIDSLDLVLNSREDFDFSKNLLKFPDSLTDVERASCFYQVIKFSYGAGGKTYGGNPVKIKKSFPLIRACSERLEDVVIENRDFQKLIEQYDREQALFFCDPPYFGTEDYYDNVDFLRENHYRLKDTLDAIRGKFLLTYNDCPFIRDLYRGYYQQPVSRINNLALGSANYQEYKELIITNYDPEQECASVKQLSLFEI